MTHLQTPHGVGFMDWMREVNVLKSHAVEKNPDEVNCITSMLQNPDSFRTHNAVDFLDMHFTFFKRDKDSNEIPEVPSANRMLLAQYFLNRWRREWYHASESRVWFKEMFGPRLTKRQITYLWRHLRKMRDVLEEKLEIKELAAEYERAYMDQSVLRSVSPTPTAGDYFSDSGSSATPSPPYSPPSHWGYEQNDIVPQMSPSWGDADSDSFLLKGDNDPETRRR